MRCAECNREATHEVRRKRVGATGNADPAPTNSEYFCDAHALVVWRATGYRTRILPLYAVPAGGGA